MERTLVLYVDDGVSDHALFFAGRFVPDIMTDRLAIESIADSVVFSVSPDYKGELISRKETLVRSGDDIACWKEIAEKTGAKYILKMAADAPFANPSVIAEMISIHQKYLAEFTYSENLPAGLSCEIISTELVKSLPDDDGKRLPLSQVIRSNINQFDVELYYKGPDIRDTRLSFRTSDPREKRIMEGLYTRCGGFPPYEDLKKLIEEHCDLLYVGPSYLEIEITGNADVESIYSWRKGMRAVRGDMDVSLFKKILSDMREFNLPYAVCLGGAGDPVCHPSFYNMLDAVHGEELVRAIIIETDGVRCDAGFAQYIANARDPRVTIIVDCSGSDEKSYAELHGVDQFAAVHGNVIAVRNAMGDLAKNLYVQIMKIRETEPLIDRYYDFWEAEKAQIILQKQNVFLGAIEDRRYYDLTPLDRVPCWHLQRDLFIMADGRVGFCKQDINGTWSKWNTTDTTVSDIWNARKELFLADYRGKRAISPDCASCDEWYTFNL
jgi:spiro-SPASM protein